jgi:glycerol-3-phosphate acyltransferase PlsY
MNIGVVIVIALASYLIGSISFARIVTKRLAPGKDVTQFEFPIEGTGERYKVMEIGAEAVSSQLGPKAGMTVTILDMLKVILPTLFCRLYFHGQPEYMLTAAVAGVVGHIWPIYYRFHGGMGFSTILGGLLVIDPLAVLVVPVVGLLLGMFVLRNMIATNVTWVVLLIPWFWWRFGGDPLYILYAVCVLLLFTLAMIPEIKMMIKHAREGTFTAFTTGHVTSNPMGRGMIKMAKYFKIDLK